MDATQVFTAGQQGLWILLMVSAPVLIVVLAAIGPLATSVLA